MERESLCSTNDWSAVQGGREEPDDLFAAIGAVMITTAVRATRATSKWLVWCRRPVFVFLS